MSKIFKDKKFKQNYSGHIVANLGVCCLCHSTHGLWTSRGKTSWNPSVNSVKLIPLLAMGSKPISCHVFVCILTHKVLYNLNNVMS